MTRKVDPAEAALIMRAAGCVPLVPYPGSGVPWPCTHEPYGEQIAPLFSNARKRGTACRRCAGEKRDATRRAGLADSAESTMRAAQFEPLDPYPGASKPWRCRHEPCGQVRTPTLNTVRRNGTACRPCWLTEQGFTVWSANSAETYLRDHVLEPLQPYPGSSSVPWPARHTTCGRVVTPRLANLAVGQGACRECGQEAAHSAQQLNHDEAAALMRSAGLEPLEPFPGVDRPWRCRHARCGRESSPTYKHQTRPGWLPLLRGPRRLRPHSHARTGRARDHEPLRPRTARALSRKRKALAMPPHVRQDRGPDPEQRGPGPRHLSLLPQRISLGRPCHPSPRRGSRRRQDRVRQTRWQTHRRSPPARLAARLEPRCAHR